MGLRARVRASHRARVWPKARVGAMGEGYGTLMKNCDPPDSGPELAMLSVPGSVRVRVRVRVRV